MRISEILNKVEFISFSGNSNKNITDIHYDSRQIVPGCCFTAIEGSRFNGNNFIGDAVSRGAEMVVSCNESDRNYKNPAWLRVKNVRKTLGVLSEIIFNYPLREKNVIGVTGTNGKTSVVSMIYGIKKRIEKPVKIGTLGMEINNIHKKSFLTTPEISDLFRFLSIDCNNNFDSVIMEVSSAALAMNRVENIEFSQAVFTNFSGDHLDFHGNMNSYFEAKLSLFDRLSGNGTAVLNIEDPMSDKIIDRINSKFITYGFNKNADVYPIDYKLSMNGIEAKIETPAGMIRIDCPLLGRINLLNILAAVASSTVSEVRIVDIEDGISGFQQITGRLNVVYKNDFTVLVDYAHTDDALKNLLISLRELTEKRIILIFGAGGSRDKTKRPRMGRAACEYSDFVIVTSDNPRNEDPMEIISDIKKGFLDGFSEYVVEANRKKAISAAISEADPGDIVVIAGKGHEDYQIFKERTIHFDDREVVTSIIKEGFSA